MKILPQLLRVYSREDALQKAETGRADKRLIETALRFYATEDGDIGVTYSGFCIISLPHKALKSPKDRWERRLLQNGCAMTIEPGFLEMGGKTVELGVPYGSTARLIMIYLQTEALRHNSREIMLGRSMYDWLNRMGMSVGGNSYRQVKEQAMRLSACSLRFTWDGITGGRRAAAFKKDSIIEAGMIFVDNDRAAAAQGSLVGGHDHALPDLLREAEGAPGADQCRCGARHLQPLAGDRHLCLAGLPAAHPDRPDPGAVAAADGAVRPRLPPPAPVQGEIPRIAELRPGRLSRGRGRVGRAGPGAEAFGPGHPAAPHPPGAAARRASTPPAAS